MRVAVGTLALNGTGDYAFNTTVIEAHSADEAKGAVHRLMEEKYPIQDGWRHHVKVEAIDDEEDSPLAPGEKIIP